MNAARPWTPDRGVGFEVIVAPVFDAQGRPLGTLPVEWHDTGELVWIPEEILAQVRAMVQTARQRRRARREESRN